MKYFNWSTQTEDSKSENFNGSVGVRFLLPSIIFPHLQLRMRRSREATDYSVYEQSSKFINQSECRISGTKELLVFNILFFYHVKEIAFNNCEKLISNLEFSNYKNFRAIPKNQPLLRNMPSILQIEREMLTSMLSKNYKVV